MSTLILSGWAQPADALAHIAEDVVTFDYSDYSTIEAALSALKNIAHTKCVAWSLGGIIAMHAIAAGVLNPRHLTLIAAPYQFVQSANFHDAMDTFTYETFRDNYMRDPARTKERFHALVAKGDRDFKRVLGALQHHPEVENTARWLPWLNWLATQKPPSAITAPTLLIHGKNDAIVPHQQSQLYAQLLPQAQLSLWDETGHAPHLHDPARLRAEIAAHQKVLGL